MQNYPITNILHGGEIDFSKVNNKYVYLKQNFVPAVKAPIVSSKVLVNPHFNKTVFVNPNFRPTSAPPPASGKIHINPNVTSINLPKDNGKIHINPKILRNISGSLENKISVQPSISRPGPINQPITYSSKTKLIRKPVKEQTVEARRIRRSSVYSKFKTVKSSLANKPREVKSKNKLLFNSKYKLKRVCANKSEKYLTSQNLKLKNRFKLDNRKKRSNSSSKYKFMFVNRFLSISDMAKIVPLRTKSLVSISGIMYKNSPNRLQKASLVQKDKKNSFIKLGKPLKKDRFKIVRVSQAKPNYEKKRVEKNIVTRYSSRKQKISAEKLKKCNIPCPYYRKFGKCKGKELGKCPRKHDPDQIALCTKFLQGACIDPKCLLSHNVSPEKMPTCKYYLEGSCSKDNCPYLHVRISPKADICRDFLEGFCKKASECDKRHQFLCPDYEKKGTCLKQRCSYPHGRMVRKYSVFNKHKFAKKSSVNIIESTASTSKEHAVVVNKNEERIEKEITTTTRYYSDKNIKNAPNSVENEVDPNQKINFIFRPKLGELPSFIMLEDT